MSANVRLGTVTLALAACLANIDTAAGQEGWFGYAEYLYLTSSGPDFTYAADASAGMPNGTIHNVGSHSNSAVGTGFGYRLATGLDVSLRYMTFESGSSDAQTPPPGRFLNTVRLHPDNSSLTATSASAGARMQLHVFDIEMGTWFDATGDVAARPFVGFRGGLIDHTLDTRYTVGAGSRNSGDSVDLDAFGLRVGSDLRWELFDDLLYIEGGASGSLLLGRSRTRHFESGTLSAMDVRDDYNHAVPVADAYVGLVYQNGPFFMSGGYTTSAWFDTGSYLTFVDDVADGSHVRDSTDLLLGGGYFRLGWNW